MRPSWWPCARCSSRRPRASSRPRTRRRRFSPSGVSTLVWPEASASASRELSQGLRSKACPPLPRAQKPGAVHFQYTDPQSSASARAASHQPVPQKTEPPSFVPRAGAPQQAQRSEHDRYAATFAALARGAPLAAPDPNYPRLISVGDRRACAAWTPQAPTSARRPPRRSSPEWASDAPCASAGDTRRRWRRLEKPSPYPR
mmetsp:Transcript_29419/g.80425  ORF Transcript_29419/g.80425 Transcript_29419/m.80425 type:complete len:201 (+) Transcript_29419:1022-1624(+)